MAETDQPRLARSGRTARMLFEACQLALHGQPVHVFGADREHCEKLKDQFRELMGVDAETVGVIVRPVPVQYNWQAMQAPGWGAQGKPYLIDHHVIERHFAKMLKELHRFDQRQLPVEFPALLEGEWL